MNKKAAINQIITFEENPFERAFDAWILYANDDRSLNQHYIDLYRNACRRRGMSIGLGIYHPGSVRWEDSCRITSLAVDEKPACVINRTRDYRLAEFLESLGIRVFNDSWLTRLGNDKSEAYRYMQQRGIPVMPTLYSIQTAPQWYPAVVKSRDGHGGTDVFLIRDETAWKEWTNRNIPNKKNYLVQQAASDLGKDVRVYIVGNRIAAAVLRTSKTDFRGNYCLGANVEMYQLSGQELELVQHAIEGLSVGMAGIDFIFHEGKMVFNEIEDMAGARGLYSLTDYDIVDEYISYIQEELQSAGKTIGKTEGL